MCGIVGYIGNKNCVPIITNGLKMLEYRGYDSAGIGIIKGANCYIQKSPGKVSILDEALKLSKISSTIGIGHTRWATHGGPTEINAHPHFNSDKTICLIHNGIIENYSVLKKELITEGYEFVSETDTEVLVHLIDRFFKRGNTLLRSVRKALTEVDGAYGLCVISADEPDKIVVARKGSPLVIGIGNNENFVASDVSALVAHTSQVVYLDDNEIAEVYKDHFNAYSITDEEIQKEIEEVTVTLEEISKGGYNHFMMKEIMEQPESITNSMRGRILLKEGTVKLGGLLSVQDKLANAKRIIICACGTSWHAGLVAEYMIEQFAEIPVEVEYASEFRYRNPIVQKDDAMIFISQSGETADTLAAMKEAKRKGALVLGVCNVVGSSIARESDAGVYIHAGPEIGVASTKAFTSQLVVFALITVLLARKRHMSEIDGKNILTELTKIPEKVEQILKLNDEIEKIA
ncbi:MAG: glutamine--fructose-6-phosphate transaminase (isomerizing), partial [Ignavibacteriae bacterium]|nr:glutamine--fructose-6-phosphate transaminase (isomerizing) [Ignavibacteriota bacterium]